MKKTVAVYTLNGFTNFGNRLQNYALVNYINKLGVECENYWNMPIRDKMVNLIKIFIPTKKYRRIKRFILFNKKIKTCYNKKHYDYIIVGSDQVWNPSFSSNYKSYLLQNFNSKNKISYSASIGVDKLNAGILQNFQEELSKFKAISVREDNAKKLIKNCLPNKKIEVLIDPTMLLDTGDWEKIITKPNNLKSKKYILNYFLGELSDDRKREIERIAKENDCEIINILDMNDSMYISGPSEFLYLEKNAFLICTDSFHSSVFAILFNRPFIVFDREQKKIESMGSRIDTLIDKFKLKNRKYNGMKITEENLKHDYSEAYKILEKEREKSMKFLENALDIKKR